MKFKAVDTILYVHGGAFAPAAEQTAALWAWGKAQQGRCRVLRDRDDEPKRGTRWRRHLGRMVGGGHVHRIAIYRLACLSYRAREIAKFLRHCHGHGVEVFILGDGWKIPPDARGERVLRFLEDAVRWELRKPTLARRKPRRPVNIEHLLQYVRDGILSLPQIAQVMGVPTMRVRRAIANRGGVRAHRYWRRRRMTRGQRSLVQEAVDFHVAVREKGGRPKWEYPDGIVPTKPRTRRYRRRAGSRRRQSAHAQQAQRDQPG